MPQSTNLNKNPYYDDFSDEKNFYKVLFKPGVTVQTRELTSLQSILQNQIEKLGGAFFKKNSVVVPGGFAYDSSFYAVEIENTYKGIDVENYFESLVGLTLTGKVSSVTAKVEKVLTREESIRNTTTLYIKYQTSSSENFSSNVFEDGEELIVNQSINLDDNLILSGSAIAKTISPTNRTSTSVASCAKIDDGVYFIKGFLVNVYKDILILDQYSNTPSYRVGLNINEQIVGVSEDSSLYDNAQGFSNYAAPGADRLKISLSLTKKDLNDFNDENFLELFRVDKGNLIQIKNNTSNSLLEDVLARRTFDESGNYYVKPFNVESLESLNDNLGNGGVYLEGDLTVNEINPSKDNAIIKVSPGKAYVKGYEVPTNTELLELPKPRTTKHVESSSSAFLVGNLIRVNNVKNLPTVNLTTESTISLYDRRLTSTGSTSEFANQIGVARVYDFQSYLSSYKNKASQFNLRLFDIQTYSTVDSDSDLNSVGIGSYVKGSQSGSTGFVKELSGQSLTLYQVSGDFISNENLIINGIESNISVGTFRNYSIEDIKAISDGTFASDTVLSNDIVLPGTFSFNQSSKRIYSDNGSSFASKLKINDVIKYSISGIGSDVYARVSEIPVTKNYVEISSVPTVEDVCYDGYDYTSDASIQSISIIRSKVIQSDDSSLTSKLSNTNISNVDLLNSNIYIKVFYDSVSKSSTTLTLPSLSGTDYVYSTYDSERYSVVNADGSVEDLDSATLTITGGGKYAEFTNLSSSSGPCRVITTQIKSNVSQKFKKLSRCNSLTISKTKYSVPANAGLTYSEVYGTRVEDDQISLNVGDVLTVHGIFESSTTSNPILPSITVSGIGNVDDLILGELFVGETSGASAIYTKKKGSNQLYLINKNQTSFVLGETILFSESKYNATITEIFSGDNNIIDEFILDNGQRSYFYDFGRIIKQNNSREPSSRLTIFFDNFVYDLNDYGDLISSNSYPLTLDKNNIPIFNGSRNTDIIDIRPKVLNYNTSSFISPFEFSSRNFSSQSNNSFQILSPNENFIFDYDFYIPRIDKLILSKDGSFNIVFGEPNEIPLIPSTSNEVLEIATIINNAYVYDVKKDIKIIISDHRRYTMSDLRDIDNRVTNLEYYTTLSLLESSTKNLLITDENGLNRFKSGFFVDEFNNYDTSDRNNVSYYALIRNKTLSAVKHEERINLSLSYNDDYTSFEDIDLSTTSCNNLKITGDTLSLDYNEVTSINQPFASKVVNVNPFNISTWQGVLELNPTKDVWSVNVYERQTKWGHKKSRTIIITETIPFIRTRNIKFTAVNLKPNTRFKLLFDKKDLSSNTLNSSAFPKFIEIKNNIGSFKIGETVNCLDSKGKVSCNFRICSPDHKSGPIDSPTLKFKKNPYNSSVGISSQYGPQSKFLNIDLNSLSREDISKFWGKILKGNKLVGTISKSTAIISDIRLVTDDEGTLLGSIWIDENDKFSTGQTSVDLILNNPPTRVSGEISNSSASAIYTTQGTKIRNIKIRYRDPLAQTFLVEEENGIIPTSVDVYFYTKDSSIPITLEIREVSLGIPGGPDKVLFTKVLSSSEIVTSNNASKKTTFKFDTLDRLSPGEYAIVLISDSNEYQVWISELNSEDISTKNLPAINKVFITRQPSLGTLFKSQNATTWVPSPLEDLKFTLKKAEFITSGGTARFYNSTDFVINPENKLPNNPITAISNSGYPNDGRHILVFHPDHGMHSSNNQVEIVGVEPDSLPEKLTVSYASTDTGPISVGNTSIFSTFEGSEVSSGNPGYIKIGNEIIEYTGFNTPDQLTGISRGVYGTIPYSHDSDSDVYKYEFNNVSLSRINTQFTVLSDPKPTLDTYYVQINSGSVFAQTKTSGGDSVYASKNKQFSEISFNPDLVAQFNGTEISASVRTITSTSIDGSETSFVDKGFESIGINTITSFDSPRMVASKINETNYLNSTNFIGNKSFTLELNLNTSDTNLSPLINLTQNYVTTEIYSINQPIGITSYSSDRRVNSNTDDPHSFIHITNRVDLQQSANSLKVLLSSYRSYSSDIRVLYKIFTNDVPDDQQIWRLFPGYDNLDVNNNIINPDNNNGKSDSKVRSSLKNEYLDYTFSIDNISEFTGFQIKIIGTSTNQAESPLIKDLRVIAIR